MDGNSYLLCRFYWNINSVLCSLWYPEFNSTMLLKQLLTSLFCIGYLMYSGDWTSSGLIWSSCLLNNNSLCWIYYGVIKTTFEVFLKNSLHHKIYIPFSPMSHLFVFNTFYFLNIRLNKKIPIYFINHCWNFEPGDGWSHKHIIIGIHGNRVGQGIFGIHRGKQSTRECRITGDHFVSASQCRLVYDVVSVVCVLCVNVD